MNRVRAILVGFVLMLLVVFLAPTTAQAAPYCGITWGSLAKTQAVGGPVNDDIYNIRAGRNTCFDRLVVDIDKGVGYRGFDVRYGTAHQEGSGAAIPLRGEDMQIVVYADNFNGTRVTYNPANRNEAVNVAGFTTFRQVAWGGSFEGQSTIGLGVRARLPMRAFVLAGPGDDSRLVVDVAHRW